MQTVSKKDGSATWFLNHLSIARVSANHSWLLTAYTYISSTRSIMADSVIRLDDASSSNSDQRRRSWCASSLKMKISCPGFTGLKTSSQISFCSRKEHLARAPSTCCHKPKSKCPE